MPTTLLTPRASVRHRIGWAGLVWTVLPALTIAAFSPVFWNGFINFDDPFYITENPWVRQGLTWSGICWVCAHPHMGLYHPLGVLPLMAIRSLFGMEPAAFHAASLVIHVVSSLLVFQILRLLTGSDWRSALAGLVFALHPLRVESVAWAAEMKDVLSVVFILLAIRAYIAYTRRPAWWRIGLVAGLQALSLLAKPMYVTLPLLLLLLDYWPLRRADTIMPASRPRAPSMPGQTAPINAVPRKTKTPRRSCSNGVGKAPVRRCAGSVPGDTKLRLVFEKWPLFLVSVIDFLAVPLMARRTLQPNYSNYPSYSVWQRLANVPVSYERYIVKMFDTFHLAPFYPMPDRWPAGRVMADSGVLLLITLAVWLGRRRRHLLVGWLWFLILLLPVIGILQVSGYSLADRYTYLSSLGLIVALVWSVPDKFLRGAGSIATAGCILLLAIGTWRQSRLWHDSVTLFRHTIQVTPDNALAEANLGEALNASGALAEGAAHVERAAQLWPSHDALVNLGNLRARQGRLDDAVAAYQTALQNSADDPDSWVALGNVQSRRGNRQGALDCFNRAIEINPANGRALDSLGAELGDAGRSADAVAILSRALANDPDDRIAHLNISGPLLRLGERAQATRHARQAVAADPSDASAHFMLAQALQQQPETVDQAVAEYRKAIALQPSDADAYVNLGALYAERAEFDVALELHRRAVSLAPENADAWINLGLDLANLGQSQEAERAYRTALRIKPDRPDAHLNLVGVLLRLNRIDEAVAEAGIAVRLDPSSGDARFNLALALERAGRVDEAEEALHEAAHIRGEDPDIRNALARLAALRAKSR